MPRKPAPTKPHELPPRLLVREDGTHVAVCPACGEQSPVPVTHRRDPEARFVLRADPETGKPTEVTHGEVATFDFSRHERHVGEAHA